MAETLRQIYLSFFFGRGFFMDETPTM